MKNFLADIMMKSENPDLFEYIIYKKLHGTKSTVKKEEGVPPLTFTSSGFPLNSYQIFGNTVQNGTPAPDDPVDVVGVGERTENLFDISSAVRYEYVITNVYADQITDGTLSAYAGGYCYVIEASPGVTYTLKVHSSDDVAVLRAGFYSLPAPSLEDRIVHDGTQASNYIPNPTITITNSGNYPYLILQMSGPYVQYLTITVGSTPPASFIPYGYKIPVSNNTDDYVIYLTEPLQKIGSYVDDVESTGIITRSIKKIVLDGSEEWQKYGSDEYAYFRLGTGDTTGVRNILSDRFEFVENFEDVTTVGASISGTGQIRIRPSDVSDMSILEWSTWLSENPTTIYYTISTSTTETTTCPSIDTDEGSNTFDVDTTITPSNVILYHT